MRKILCLLLAMLLLLSLCACGNRGKDKDEDDGEVAHRHVSHRSEDKTPADATPLPAAPEPQRSERVPVELSEIPEEALRLLGCFGWFARSDAQSFASTREDAILLMRIGFELIVPFDSYPGPKSVYQSTADPRGRWQYCEVFDAEKAEKVLKTVYHFSDDAIRVIRERGEDENAGFYFFDGNYYISEQGVGGGTICCPLYAESDGVDLYLYYAAYNGDVFYYNGGTQYAVLSEDKLDGETVWTLKTWSRALPVIGTADMSSKPLDALGDWILEEDSLSSLRMKDYADGRYTFDFGFYRLFGCEAEAQLIKGSELAVFSATDGTGFQGLMQIGGNALTLYLYDSPNLTGSEGFDERFNGRAYRFVRDDGTHAPAEPDFSITQEELEAEIVRVRAVYYTPGAEDSKRVLSNGTDGWNYSREYYYHAGQLVFAFIYDGTEEHRLYFKDGHMIRYIDEHHTVFDFGALDPFSSWAERALEEAERLYATDPVDPSAWLGVWETGGEEWIQVTDADENGVSFIFHHSTELGTTDTEYTLPYLSADRRSVAEDESLIVNGGWRYAFYLEDGYILVTSRYPDKLFYRHEPAQP